MIASLTFVFAHIASLRSAKALLDFDNINDKAVCE